MSISGNAKLGKSTLKSIFSPFPYKKIFQGQELLNRKSIYTFYPLNLELFSVHFATACSYKLLFSFWWNFSTKKFFSASVHLQISPGLQKHTCCAVWISFSDHRLLTKRGEKKDFYQTLFTGQWIFFTIWMYLWNAWVIHYSRFWSMTMGRRNDWWYLFPDFISLILFIPWPVYLD